MIDRRDALRFALGSAAVLAAPAAFAQSPAKPRTKIVFLGTKGGPRVDVGPSNPANLVVVNDTPFVIDCGMRVSRQLASAGVPLASVKYIFISHHHSDHNLEYGNLVYNAWAAVFSSDTAYNPKFAKGADVLVLSHLVPGDLDVTDDTWTEAAKKNFSGKIVVARDLMELKLPVWPFFILPVAPGFN
jgi:ribonuclease BN (tRNA processing enzyme)